MIKIGRGSEGILEKRRSQGEPRKNPPWRPKLLPNYELTVRPLERNALLTPVVLTWTEGVAWVAAGFGVVLDRCFWNYSGGAPWSLSHV